MGLRKDWLKRELGTFDIYSLVHSDSQSTYYLLIGFIAFYAAENFFLVALYAIALMIIIALIYGEMGSHFPETGGSYIYVKYSLGSFIGFISTWLLALDQIIMVGYGTLDTAIYMSKALEYYNINITAYIPENILAILFATALYILTLIGIRESATVASRIAMLDILAIGSILLFNTAIIIRDQQLYAFPKFSWSGISSLNILYALALASRGFTGLDAIGQLAGEAKKPLIQIPRATFLVILIGALFSFLISMVLMNRVSYTELYKDPAIAILLIARETPLIQDLVVPLVTLDIILIMLMASLTGYVSFSRLLYILSLDNLTYRGLSKIHKRFRTPYVSLTLSYLIAILLLSPGEITIIIELYAIGSLINYLIVAISLAVLSRRRVLYGGFITPRIKEIPITVIIGVPMIGVALGFAFLEKYYALGIIGLWVFAGLIMYTIQTRIIGKSKPSTTVS
ncbi:MAG: APC family permease [Sulfolobales archaeon]